MLVIPAIDLAAGQCVRLTQGDMRRKTVYHDDPAEVARWWTDQGAALIHIVDLDGAMGGSLANESSIRAIRRATQAPLEIGGGIRTADDVARVLDLGATHAIMGTTALRDPEALTQALARFPAQIIVGIDARDGRVAVEGWTESTDIAAVDLARRMGQMGVRRLIATDIATDGVLRGPNLAAMQAIAEASRVEVIASGGVSSLADIRALAELERLGVVGCIVGRALYVGAFTLPDALRAGAGGEGTE